MDCGYTGELPLFTSIQLSFGKCRLMTDSQSRRLWVIIPAFNEARVIADVVAVVRRACPNMVVVDDCLRDDTGDRARAGGGIVLHRFVNLGQGAALQTRIDDARGKGSEFIVTFDANGQHRVMAPEAAAPAQGFPPARLASSGRSGRNATHPTRLRHGVGRSPYS
ncbi:MAG: glycosyltransferase [Alphaproteobacteria bacterium]